MTNTNGYSKPELPEAPASFTVRAVSPTGFGVMFTVRDHQVKSLIGKAEVLLVYLADHDYRPEGKSASVPTAASHGAGSMVCPTHGKPLKASQHRPGELFCTAKVADDDGSGTGRAVYCKYKVKP